MLTANPPATCPEAKDDSLLNELVYCEGIKTRIYLDSRGNETGGIGWNFKANGIPEWVVLGLYNQALCQSITDLDNDYPWWRGLDSVRQRALLNFMFNVGPATFKEFSTFLGMMQRGEYSQAADDLEAQHWYSEVGERGPLLISMFRTGFAVNVPIATWPRP